MHTHKPRNGAVPGHPIFKGMSWLVLGALAWSFQAQADDDADDAIEEIIVTGSLIKRDNFDSASPLQVLEAAEIEAEATPALGEIIYNQTFNYGSDAFSSHYSVTNPEGNRTGANFRGLGGGATLTLLDGKRVLDSNLNNLIPQIAIERIDILKDGASAIYGSDAVAGVINVIPKKAVQGAEIGAFFNTDHHRDHDEYVVNFVIGDTMDRGYFTLAMEHRERTGLAQTERANLLGRVCRVQVPVTRVRTTSLCGMRRARLQGLSRWLIQDVASPKAPVATVLTKSATCATTLVGAFLVRFAGLSLASSLTSSRPTRF